MRALFRLPGFPLWFLGRCADWTADSLLTLVLSIWVKSLTGSNSLAVLGFVFLVGPAVLAPFAGLLIDRYRPRRALIVGNILSALALAPLILVHNARDVPIIWVASVLYGMSGAILPAASTAMMRSTVPAEMLGDANSFVSIFGNLATLLGPAAGAGLFALGGPLLPIGLTFSLFVAGGATFIFMRESSEIVGSTDRGWAAMTAGFRHIWAQPILRGGLIALLIVELVGGFVQGSIFPILDSYHQPVALAGGLMTATGIGAALGSFAAGPMLRRWSEPAVMLGAMTYLVIGVALLTLAPTFVVFVGGLVLVATGITPMYVAFATLLQTQTPPDLMGRTQAATAPLFAICVIVSFSVAAVAIAWVPWRVSYLIIAGIIAIAGLFLATSLRRVQSTFKGASPAFSCDCKAPTQARKGSSSSR